MLLGQENPQTKIFCQICGGMVPYFINWQKVFVELCKNLLSRVWGNSGLVLSFFFFFVTNNAVPLKFVIRLLAHLNIHSILKRTYAFRWCYNLKALNTSEIYYTKFHMSNSKCLNTQHSFKQLQHQYFQEHISSQSSFHGYYPLWQQLSSCFVFTNPLLLTHMAVALPIQMTNRTLWRSIVSKAFLKLSSKTSHHHQFPCPKQDNICLNSEPEWVWLIQSVGGHHTGGTST